MNSGATFFGRDRRLSGLRWCSPPPPQRSCLPPARVAAQERDMGACFSCIGGRVGPGAPGACRKRCGALCIGLSGCGGSGWSCLCRVSAAVRDRPGAVTDHSLASVLQRLRATPPAGAPGCGGGVRSPLSSGVRRTRPVGRVEAWRGAASRGHAAAAHPGSGTTVARAGLLAPVGKRAGRRGGTAARPAHLGPTPRRWAVGVEGALGRRRRRLDRPASGCGESVLGLEADIRSLPNAPQVGGAGRSGGFAARPRATEPPSWAGGGIGCVV